MLQSIGNILRAAIFQCIAWQPDSHSDCLQIMASDLVLLLQYHHNWNEISRFLDKLENGATTQSVILHARSYPTQREVIIANQTHGFLKMVLINFVLSQVPSLNASASSFAGSSESEIGGNVNLLVIAHCVAKALPSPNEAKDLFSHRSWNITF